VSSAKAMDRVIAVEAIHWARVCLTARTLCAGCSKTSELFFAKCESLEAGIEAVA
jgi:hypothetical protein